MIGVAIPAHNEGRLLPSCLRALRRAATHPALRGEPVRVVVALDDCDDDSEDACAAEGVATVRLHSRAVGAARAAAADWLLAQGARWICCTDADTLVSPRWIAEHVGLGVDAVCGTVGLRPHGDEALAPAVLREHFRVGYRDADGHAHVHGANLGIDAQAYRRAGGFAPLRCHEDVMLVEALRNVGASIAWSARPRVYTSTRASARVRGGFGDTVSALAERACAPLKIPLSIA